MPKKSGFLLCLCGICLLVGCSNDGSDPNAPKGLTTDEVKQLPPDQQKVISDAQVASQKAGEDQMRRMQRQKGGG